MATLTLYTEYEKHCAATDINKVTPQQLLILLQKVYSMQIADPSQVCLRPKTNTETLRGIPLTCLLILRNFVVVKDHVDLFREYQQDLVALYSDIKYSKWVGAILSKMD